MWNLRVDKYSLQKKSIGQEAFVNPDHIKLNLILDQNAQVWAFWIRIPRRMQHAAQHDQLTGNNNPYYS